MPLLKLELQNFRVFAHETLSLDHGFNWIVGPNGSGKTTILEAVWVMGCLRSFRTHRLTDLVAFGARGFQVGGRTRPRTAQRDTRLRVERCSDGLLASIDGMRVRRASELARELPMVLIDPTVQRFVLGTPKDRRRFLDWALFHVKPGFAALWRDFHDTLRQRNAALRGSGATLSSWDEILSNCVTALDAARRASVAVLGEFIGAWSALLPGVEVELRYRRGWSEELSFPERLVRARDSDREVGYTQEGPHKADLALYVNGRPAQRVLSRGQTKLLGVMLVGAQAAWMNAQQAGGTIVLADDLGSEFDTEFLARTLELLRSLDTQVLITALDVSRLPAGANAFHVNQGRVQGH